MLVILVVVVAQRKELLVKPKASCMTGCYQQKVVHYYSESISLQPSLTTKSPKALTTSTRSTIIVSIVIDFAKVFFVTVLQAIIACCLTQNSNSPAKKHKSNSYLWINKLLSLYWHMTTEYCIWKKVLDIWLFPFCPSFCLPDISSGPWLPPFFWEHSSN